MEIVLDHTLSPTEDNLQYWMHTFVPPQVLWYWDDSPLPLGPVRPSVVECAVARQHQSTAAIEMVNAFHLWSRDDAVQQIIVDDDAWLPSLSAADRTRVRAAQVKWNRGLCVPRDRFPIASASLDEATFDGNVVLDNDLWSELPESVRRAVILTELPLWDDADIQDVPPGCAEHIAAIANTFVQQEGINCLAVTSYALTGSRTDLHQWMQPEQLLQILRTYGYQEHATGEHRAGDVLAWYSGSDLIHASFVLEPDRVLNKSGQSSFNPIRIVNCTLLQRDWKGYRRVTFRRSTRPCARSDGPAITTS